MHISCNTYLSLNKGNYYVFLSPGPITFIISLVFTDQGIVPGPQPCVNKIPYFYMGFLIFMADFVVIRREFVRADLFVVIIRYEFCGLGYSRKFLPSPHRGCQCYMQKVWNSTCYFAKFSWKSRVRKQRNLDFERLGDFFGGEIYMKKTIFV